MKVIIPRFQHCSQHTNPLMCFVSNPIKPTKSTMARHRRIAKQNWHSRRLVHDSKKTCQHVVLRRIDTPKDTWLEHILYCLKTIFGKWNNIQETPLFITTPTSKPLFFSPTKRIKFESEKRCWYACKMTWMSTQFLNPNFSNCSWLTKKNQPSSYLHRKKHMNLLWFMGWVGDSWDAFFGGGNLPKAKLRFVAKGETVSWVILL